MRIALFLVSLMLVMILPVSGEEEMLPMTQSIEEGRLKVTASTNPNSSYEFVQNGSSWELDLSTLPDGKHTIGLKSDGYEQLAVFCQPERSRKHLLGNQSVDSEQFAVNYWSTSTSRC